MSSLTTISDTGGFIDNALLPKHENVFYLINVSGLIIAIIIQLFTGVFAFRKSRSPEPKIRGELAILFWFSFIFALLYTSGYLAIWGMYAVYLSDSVVNVMFCILEFFWLLFPFMLLLNLVVRLYLTFKPSSLAMSQSTQYIFIFIFVVLFLLIVLNSVAIIVHFYGDEQLGWILWDYALFSILSFYIIGSALAVRLFVVNLSTIAKLQACSQRDLTADPAKISLNERQLTLLHLSAKFELLFFVAILSTIVATVFCYIVSYFLNPLFLSIDLCVSLFCIYLQFAFAANHYQKCCGCLDSCCRAIVVQRTKKTMHRESIDMKNRIPSGSMSPPSVQTETSGTVEM